MKKIKGCTIFLYTTALCFFAIHCTKNPVFDDNLIPVEKRWVRGHVELDDGRPATGAAVWFSGYDVGCYTDDDGVFELALPGGGSQASGAETGLFPLYVYVNNYKYHVCNVLIQDGKVVDGQGAIGQDGWVENVIELENIVSVHTSAYYWYNPYKNDSCVAFTTQCDIKKPPIKLLLRDGRLSTFFLFPEEIPGMERMIKDNPTVPASYTSIHQNQWNGAHYIRLNGGILKPGNYEYVPWLIAFQPDLPEGLKQFIGYDLVSVDMSYFNLPFVRSGGCFTLIWDMHQYDVVERRKEL